MTTKPPHGNQKRSPEYWAEYQKDWARRKRIEKRDEVRAYEREAYRKRKERIANDPVYRELHALRHRESNKRSRAKNSHRVKASAKRYYEANKACINAKNAVWARQNGDKVKGYRKNWAAKNPTWMQEWHVKNKHSLTLDEYTQLKQRFNNQCGCCRKPVAGRALHVDHCHRTGVVRGILCRGCNTAIGMLGDTLESVRNAVRYLESCEQEKHCA